MTELDQLRAQLAEAQAEIERLKKQLRQQAEAIASTINKHHAALAAAEARETQLCKAIVLFRNEKAVGRAGSVRATEGYAAMQYAVFDQPRDDSALRRLLAEAKAGVYEECAKVCENSDRYRGDYFAAKIRELAEKAKEEKC